MKLNKVNFLESCRVEWLAENIERDIYLKKKDGFVVEDIKYSVYTTHNSPQYTVLIIYKWETNEC